MGKVLQRLYDMYYFSMKVISPTAPENWGNPDHRRFRKTGTILIIIDFGEQGATIIIVDFGELRQPDHHRFQELGKS